MKKQIILIFLFTFIIYFLSGEGEPTPHNYFIRLADAFLHGRLYLTESPSWLSELVPFKGKYYVVSPPTPAILALPFVAIFGPDFSQTLLSVLVGSLNAALAFLVLGKLGVGERAKFWLTALFAFGTNHWYLASIGSSWYLAHVTAVFFLFLAINEVLSKQRAFLTGAFLGAAYLSHLPTIFSFPFFLILLKEKISRVFKFLCGISIFILLNFVYNFIRFGSLFDVAYKLIPGLLDEPWYSKGVFHFSYIGRNLKILLLKPPILKKEWPFIIPSWHGMAIWLATPAFVFAFFANIREKIVQLSWAAILLVLIPILMYGGAGWSQFGFRRAMDFTPFLLILTAKGIGKDLKWRHKLLIILSILVNLWGVVFINKLNWVGW